MNDEIRRLQWETNAARSAAEFVIRYANGCCQHTEAVSECPRCNLKFVARYATRAAAYFDALRAPGAVSDEVSAVDPVGFIGQGGITRGDTE